MIGKVIRGRGFAGLARYLELGRNGNLPGRVAWIEARNLPTHDPQTASLLMRATAAQSDRIQKPVYHIALSFDPDDAVDRATMLRVADRLLRDLGIQEHQALIVAHGDTRHAHLHIMVNRVHPQTYRAWDPRHDFAQIERSLREQERELALRAVPGHHYRLDGHVQPDRSQALTTGQLRRWERTGEVPFDELVRQVVQRDVAGARSWADLEARLRKHGLRIEPRGRGFVVTDGKESVKASSVAPGASRKNLVERFGMYEERQHAEDREPAERSAGAAEAGERDVGALGRDGGHAARAAREAERNGDDDRPRGERDGTQPGVHGREAAAARGTDGVDPDRRDRASTDRGDAGRTGRSALDPRLDAVRRTINELERRIELETARDRVANELDRARSRVEPLTSQRAEALDASRRFRAALADVYRDPAAARREFHARAARDGVATAAAEIGRRPETLGELRGTQVGPIRSAGRREALEASAKLEHHGGEHVRRTTEAWAGRGEYRDARASVGHLDRRIKVLDSELARGPGSAQLEHRLTRELRALQPAQRQSLQRALPVPHQRLLTAAMWAGHSFAREQGHER
jgi:hypothetical protein